MSQQETTNDEQRVTYSLVALINTIIMIGKNKFARATRTTNDNEQSMDVTGEQCSTRLTVQRAAMTFILAEEASIFIVETLPATITRLYKFDAALVHDGFGDVASSVSIDSSSSPASSTTGMRSVRLD